MNPGRRIVSIWMFPTGVGQHITRTHFADGEPLPWARGAQ